MADYDNTNRGSLFANDRKETDTQPTHTGSVNTTCPHCGQSADYWLNAWIQTAKTSGRRFFSLSTRAKDGQAAPKPAPAQPQRPTAPPTMDGFDDDIPF